MAMLKIGSTDMPAPSVFKLSDFDIDSENTKRNEEGFMQRDRMRGGVFRIELEWHGITSTQLKTIRDAIKPASVQVTFLTEEGTQTKTMYAGDRNMELVKNHDGDVRWNFSFNFIEY